MKKRNNWCPISREGLHLLIEACECKSFHWKNLTLMIMCVWGDKR